MLPSDSARKVIFKTTQKYILSNVWLMVFCKWLNQIVISILKNKWIKNFKNYASNM